MVPVDASLAWPMRRLYLPARGELSVHHRPAEGGAPTVALLHGWLASGNVNWFPSIEALAERYGVVWFDHRGHGRGIRSSERFDFATCAADTVAVADALGVERFVPVGYSMGGAIAMTVWRDHPERVDALVLSATALRFGMLPRRRAMFATLGAGTRAIRWPAQAAYRQVAGRRAGLTDWMRNEIRMADPVALLEAGAALGGFDGRSFMTDAPVRTSVVATERDEVVPFERQREVAAAIPGAALFSVDGGHDVCVRHADRFVPVLLDAIEHATNNTRGR